jgi:hypothetical protein
VLTLLAFSFFLSDNYDYTVFIYQMKKEKFIHLGLKLLTTTLLVSSPLLSLAQTNTINTATSTSDDAFIASPNTQLEKKVALINDNEKKLEYINQVSKVFPMADKISEFDNATQTQLLKLAVPILKEEFRIDLSNNLYPYTTANSQNINLIFKTDKMGSEAVRHYDKATNQLMCNVYLGINNDKGTPTLDFYKTAEKLGIKLNSNYVRQFVLLHELSHCEANFRKTNNYFNTNLSLDENVAFNKFLNGDNGLMIESNHFEAYFDETFADTYAAINFLKLYNFSPKSVEFLKEMVSFRYAVDNFWKEHNKDVFYDPHSSASSLDLLVKSLSDTHFVNELKEDKDNQIAYRLAIKLASNHLDSLVAQKLFTDKVSQEGLEFDDTLSQIINKIRLSQSQNPQINVAMLTNTNDVNTTQYSFSKEKREMIQSSLNQLDNNSDAQNKLKTNNTNF